MDDSRNNHEKAVAFFKYFLKEKHPMILSSIVTAEFSVKQDIKDLPLKNLRPLPFNIPDSHHLGKIFEEKFKKYKKDRNSVKDDFKIVSQCSFNDIDYLITEDKAFVDLINKLKKEQILKVTPLYLPDGYELALGLPPTLF